MVEYRDIEGFAGYRVGDDGSVLSLHGRGGWNRKWEKLIPTVKNGYQRVCLYRNDKPHERSVHVLVLEAFTGKRPPKHVARHFPDRNRLNCRSENLQWGTQKENSADMRHHGTVLLGDAHPRAKLTSEIVR